MRGNLHGSECVRSPVWLLYFGMAVSKALSSHRDESEKKMHSLLFLYYPTQGHTDIMKPSFCYLEWAAHLQRLSTKWVSEKFYIHKHDHCAFWYFIFSSLLGSINFLRDSGLSSCQNVSDESIFKFKSRPILRFKKKWELSFYIK